MVPWIAKADQEELFKDNVTFDSPEEQVNCLAYLLPSVAHAAAASEGDSMVQNTIAHALAPATTCRFHNLVGSCITFTCPIVAICQRLCILLSAAVSRCILPVITFQSANLEQAQFQMSNVLYPVLAEATMAAGSKTVMIKTLISSL